MNIDGSCQVLAEEVLAVDEIDESVSEFKLFPNDYEHNLFK